MSQARSERCPRHRHQELMGSAQGTRTCQAFAARAGIGSARTVHLRLVIATPGLVVSARAVMRCLLLEFTVAVACPCMADWQI